MDSREVLQVWSEYMVNSVWRIYSFSETTEKASKVESKITLKTITTSNGNEEKQKKKCFCIPGRKIWKMKMKAKRAVDSASLISIYNEEREFILVLKTTSVLERLRGEIMT